MAIPSYTQGYPPDDSSLGETKQTIRNNLDGTFQTLSVDHQNQNQANPGYHTVIHQVSQGSTPGATGGFGQIYSQQITSGGNSDESLFYQSGGGRITQLTTNVGGAGNTWNPASNGFTTIPGGFIIQWGNAVQSSSSIQQDFLFSSTGFAFPNNCFSVQATPTYSTSVPGGAASVAIRLSTLKRTGFSFLYATNASHYTGFFWFAIGN